MAKCPKCEKEETVPTKSLKNMVFHVEAYTCKECGTNFKVTG